MDFSSAAGSVALQEANAQEQRWMHACSVVSHALARYDVGAALLGGCSCRGGGPGAFGATSDSPKWTLLICSAHSATLIHG